MPVTLRDAHALPFEIWREHGVIRLLLTHGSRIDVPMIKEIIRVMGALDPAGRSPVLLEQEERARMDDTARALLFRASQRPTRPVAFMANDLADRVQGELLTRYFNQRFPFRTFAWREDAMRWIEGWMKSPELRVVR